MEEIGVTIPIIAQENRTVASPKIYVSVEEKLSILSSVMNPVAEALAVASDGNALSADDLIDFFALALAAVIDNDSHLTTPGHLRHAVDAVSKRLGERVKLLRQHQDEAGTSVLAEMMTGAEPAGRIH